jgi:hypothetical protein
MTHHVPHTEKSAPALDLQISKFLDVSQNLLSIVQHENAIMMEEGLLSFEAYVLRKINLMTAFEEEAQKLLSLTAGSSGSGRAAHDVLVAEITRVREALQVNSSFQMNALKQKIMDRAAAAPDAGRAVCH